MIIHTELVLLPCAHCGQSGTLHNQNQNLDGGFYIECGNPLCHIATPLRFAIMDDVTPLLAEIWNRRPNIDMGDTEAQQWGNHSAIVGLNKTPAYLALLENKGKAMEQRAFLDFSADFENHISFFYEDESTASFAHATKILRRLKASATSSNEQAINNHAASRSAMESIEISAGQDPIPAFFTFTAIPYEGFEPALFRCQLLTNVSGSNVVLHYRIDQLDTITEQIGGQFRDKINGGVTVCRRNFSLVTGKLIFQ